jgi:heme exporter protein A
MERRPDPVSLMRLVVEHIGRDFNRRPVFRDISFALDSPGSLAITGLNGAGKSTFVKILAGIIGPTSGTVHYEHEGKRLSAIEIQANLGMVSPYLNLYEEFSAEENLAILSRIRSGSIASVEEIELRLRQVNLWNRRSDLVGTFSSGMKQRLKYAFALIHRPSVLLLDEPTSNLDIEGIEIVREIIAEQHHRGLLIVATNDAEEAAWCQTRVHLEGSGGGKRK